MTILKIVGTLAARMTGDESNSRETLGNEAVHSRGLATILNEIGDDWRCWRLAGESDRQFAFRLALHLESVGLAVEEDISRVLAAEKQCAAGRG